jgi:hypothetical protein
VSGPSSTHPWVRANDAEGTDGVTVAGPAASDKRNGTAWDADTLGHPLSCAFTERLGGAWDAAGATDGIWNDQLPSLPGNFWHIGPPGS